MPESEAFESEIIVSQPETLDFDGDSSSLQDSLSEASVDDKKDGGDSFDDDGVSDFLSYLEGDEGLSSPVITAGEDDSDDFSIEFVEKRLLDSKKRLQIMEYGEEIFIPSQKNGSSVLIRNDGKNYIRSFYNENFLLSSKETWKIASLDESELLLKEDFFYEEDTRQPFKKIVSSKNVRDVLLYNSDGKIVRSQKFNIITEEDALSELLALDSSWEYTENGLVSAEITKTYSYEGGILQNTAEKKQIFIYNKDDDIPPDYEYYEDGVLKIKTEYSAKSDYITQIYFDSDYSVRTYYENNIRKKDYYIIGGVVRRTKIYE